MSYCRIGEDSDVYVFCGSMFEVIHNDGKTHKLFEHQQECYDYLLQIKNTGCKIPLRVFQRMRMELSSSELFGEDNDTN